MTGPKLLWWFFKSGFFPHLDRRMKRRPSRMKEADDMLATAMINLAEVLEGKNKK